MLGNAHESPYCQPRCSYVVRTRSSVTFALRLNVGSSESLLGLDMALAASMGTTNGWASSKLSSSQVTVAELVSRTVAGRVLRSDGRRDPSQLRRSWPRSGC